MQLLAQIRHVLTSFPAFARHSTHRKRITYSCNYQRCDSDSGQYVSTINALHSLYSIDLLNSCPHVCLKCLSLSLKPTSTSRESSPSIVDTDRNRPPDNKKIAAMAGGIVGGIFIVIAAVLLLYIFPCSRRRWKEVKKYGMSHWWIQGGFQERLTHEKPYRAISCKAEMDRSPAQNRTFPSTGKFKFVNPPSGRLTLRRSHSNGRPINTRATTNNLTTTKYSPSSSTCQPQVVTNLNSQPNMPIRKHT